MVLTRRFNRILTKDKKPSSLPVLGLCGSAGVEVRGQRVATCGSWYSESPMTERVPGVEDALLLHRRSGVVTPVGQSGIAKASFLVLSTMAGLFVSCTHDGQLSATMVFTKPSYKKCKAPQLMGQTNERAREREKQLEINKLNESNFSPPFHSFRYLHCMSYCTTLSYYAN